MKTMKTIQSTLGFKKPTTSASSLSQEHVNGLVMNFIISDMQAFSIVEQQSFIELVTGLQPGETVLSRKTVANRLEKMYEEKMALVTTLLKKVSYLCTTADVWTSHNRSYMGVTGHWINTTSLTRKSAALACCRLIGHLTYDVLAGAMDTVNAKFCIRDKIIMTFTDNGANFVKAFSTFGEDEHAMPEDIQTHLVQEENDKIAFVEVGSILDDETSAELGYVLSPHQRYVTHTMNLIAMKDAESACRNGAYKKVSRAALGKCAGLWNKASRSAVAAEAVHNAVKFSLVVPNATRWNSYYHSVDKICEIVRRHSEKTLNNVCTVVGVALFWPVDISFILEYVKVMQPTAQALDVLQSETHCYMGILLPSLVSLKR